MPVERKPLFRAEILAPRAAALPMGEGAEQAREILRRWARLLFSERAEELKESEILPDFLTDIFYEVLGYVGPSAPTDRFTLSREKRVEVEGESADAVLGDFGGGRDRPLVAVEGKGPRDPLDRPFAGRRMSAVDQAYRYAINLPCDWILVTNLREIRLYHKNHDQRTFERFEIQSLAEKEAAFRQFVFLLGAERMVPAHRTGHLDELLKASEQAGLDLTRSYYAEYARIRREILDRLRQANPQVLPEILLFYTQKLLDRVLFVAFAEDRGLLPAETLRRAYEHHNPYDPAPKWETFKGLFRAIDQGSGALNIPGYNGGLFARDPGLDGIKVPDEVFAELKQLGDFNYQPPAAANGESVGARLVDVEILGHIFERSITDLERIGKELAEGRFETSRVSRRKREGAFYTPQVITRFIVGHALRPVVADRFEDLRRRHAERAGKALIKILEDPRVYDLELLKKPQREALIRFWEDWLGELEKVRILDPACGSGAFLIEAFEQLHAVYQEAADRLYELRGFSTLFDPDKTILEKNLYGVDLNEEAIEICRLSIWIKTAERGKRLADLDRKIRKGNSLVEDKEVDPRDAFDWRAVFPEAFVDGGFDVVVGNPPYVRQELLGDLKPYLERGFQSYHGMADLYVYFFERGLDLLKPGGRLSFVVTNKWLKGGYAEPLRRLLSEQAWLENLVDLGHAKEIFEDADVFPSIVVFAKPCPDTQAPVPRVAVISRDSVRIDDLDRQVEELGFEFPRTQLGSEPWTPEPSAIQALMAKIRSQGIPLAEYAKVKTYYGIKTGLNEAFLVDTASRERLLGEDPRSAEILKAYLRGEDVRRWRAEWDGLWMILLKSSDNHEWPWSTRETLEAETIFATTFPSLYRHLLPWKDRLIARSDQGRFWWELRTCSYYEVFDRPKILWQEIQYAPAFAIETAGAFANNKVFLVPSEDLYLVAALNSPLIWWHNWRYLVHLKDEALTPSEYKMEQLPIASPSEAVRMQVGSRTLRILEVQDELLHTQALVKDWLAAEHQISKPSQRLADPLTLSSDDFIEEVRRVRKKPLSAAAVRSLREEHARTIAPFAERLREAERLETELSDLVCQAYGLTPDEIELMWQTAPPRMPIARPRS